MPSNHSFKLILGSTYLSPLCHSLLYHGHVKSVRKAKTPTSSTHHGASRLPYCAEAFVVFSQDIPSQSLGFFDSKAATLDFTVAGHQLVIHHSKSLLTSDRKAGTTGAGMCVCCGCRDCTCLSYPRGSCRCRGHFLRRAFPQTMSPSARPWLCLGAVSLHTPVSCPHLATSRAGSCLVQSICSSCCMTCVCHHCRQDESILAIALDLAFMSIRRVDVIVYPTNTRHACNTCISICIIH